MNGKNDKNNVEVTTTEEVVTTKVNEETEGTNVGLSKKQKIAYWTGAGIVLILALCLAFMRPTKEPLVLEGLSDFDYQVVQTNQNDETKEYEVYLETEMEEKEALVTLAYDVAQEIRNYEEKEDTVVSVKVYQPAQPGVAVEESPKTEETVTPVVPSIIKPDLDDENHTVTIEVTDLIKVYSLIDKSLLEKDINATANWEIYGSKRVDEKHLVGSVALPTGVSEDDVYRQLKAIESEMTRFNEMSADGITYFDYEREENKLSYAYSSLYPTSLVKIECVEVVRPESTN